MRQGQPHCANLLPSWRQIVHDPPRDDEVRPGIVVAEDEIGAQVREPGCRSRQHRRDGEQAGQPIGTVGYNHGSINIHCR